MHASFTQDRLTQNRLDDVKRSTLGDENLRRSLVVEHGGIQRACVEESFTCYVIRRADRAGACERLRSEVSRKKQAAGNACLDRGGLSKQRLVRLDAPAVGIRVIEIIEGYGRLHHRSGGRNQRL